MIYLDEREQVILEYILQLTTCVTAKELAEKFSVSVRSIKYDLDNIRMWLKTQGYQLCSKRSIGYWLELDEHERNCLKEELQKSAREETNPMQDNRIKSIVFRLLLSDNYVSSEKIADQLEVSRNTVIGDLEEVERFITAHQVSLEKRSGYGLMITGSEKECRNLLEILVQNELSEYDIYQIINRLVSDDEDDSTSFGFHKNDQFFSVYKIVIEELAKQLKQSEINKLNYAELISLSFRMTIAVARMLLNKTIGSYKILTDQQRLLTKEDLTFELMAAVFQRYELPLLKDEYDYLYSDCFVLKDQQDIALVTKEIISGVSEELDVRFTSDPRLFTNLFAHLSLRLGKRKVFINEYNPFIDDIKKMHPELFEVVFETCKKLITSTPSLVNESFVAYITLHFLVFFERERKEKQLVQAVYICSTGLGVTSLIKQTIMQEIPDIEVVDFASILNAEEVIREKQPDIVISIFPIENIDIPCVKVHALPTKEDIQQIKETIQHFQNAQPVVKKHKEPLQKNKETNPKRVSRDLIVKGFIVYQKLMELFDKELLEDFRDAFLLHVFLMVHRISFDEQYKAEGTIRSEDSARYERHEEAISALFNENGLAVNQAEIITLLQYFKRNEGLEWSNYPQTQEK